MKFAIPAATLAAAALLIGIVPALNTQAQATQPATQPATPTVQPTDTAPVTTALTPSPTEAATAAAMDSGAHRLSLPVSCTLAAADCQLLNEALVNVSQENNFGFNFNLAVSLSGDHPVTLQASGTGAVNFDNTAAISDMAGLIKAHQIQIDLNGAASYGTIQQSGKTGIVLDNGVLYGLNPLNANWFGVDLTKLTPPQPSTSTQPTVPMNPQNAMMQQLMSNPDFQTGLATLVNVKGFITQARLANDATLEGQPMAQIQYTINPQVLFTSSDALPGFRSVLKAVAAMNPQGRQATMLNNLTDQQLSGLLKIVGGVFGNTTLTETRWIGTTDHLFHALNIQVQLNLNAGMMAARRGNGAMTSLNGTIGFNVQLSGIGQHTTITAPAGATMINPAQIRRMAGNGFGGYGFGGFGARPFPFLPAPNSGRPPRPATQPSVTPAPTMPATSVAATSATLSATMAATMAATPVQ